MKNEKEWLAQLKPGDPVILCGLGWGNERQIRKVDRLTKTLIILEGGARIVKKSGFSQGQGYFLTFLEEPTEEALVTVQREMRVRFIKRHIQCLEEGTDNEVETIYKIIKAAKARSDNE